MDPVSKALWLIETELDTALDLERLASVSGLSRFTLSRVFAGATGWSVMRYVKARRLSRAAHRLAKARRIFLMSLWRLVTAPMRHLRERSASTSGQPPRHCARTVT